MKRVNTLLAAFFIFQTIGFGQTLDKLDKTNGFKKFKLGSNVSSIQNIKLMSTQMGLKGVTNYTYTGTDITTFNTVPIDKITLTFYKDRLYQITVGFGTIFTEYTEPQFDLVQSNFENNFGTNYTNVSPSLQAEVLNGHIWDGKKIRLESLRLNFSEKKGSRNPKYNYIQGYILFTEKNIQREQQSSELDEHLH